MELDQLIFKRIYDWWNRDKRDETIAHPNSQLELSAVQGKLTLLASAISGEHIEILASEREGGWSNNRFFLPKSIAFFKDPALNHELYLFRVLFLATQKRLQLNWTHNEVKSIADSQLKASSTASVVLNALYQEFPYTETMHNQLHQALSVAYQTRKATLDTSWLYGRWLKNPETSQKSVNAPEDKKANPQSITTEKIAKHSDEVEQVSLNQKQMEDHVVQNNFEKVETATDYDGNSKETDADDDLNDHQDAIDELNIKHVVRTDDPNHAVYKADLALNPGLFEATDSQSFESSHWYDEWDYKQLQYKRNYCGVQHNLHRASIQGSAAELLSTHSQTLTQIQHSIKRLFTAYRNMKRVTHGGDFDLDEVIQANIDIAAGRTPCERLYVTKRRIDTDISFLLLMDNSLSTGSYIDQTPVIYLEKTIATILGQAFHNFDIPFQIDTFNSKTHNHCLYTTNKSFKENWIRTKDRIAAIEPANYTRIGAALRHATQLISAQSTSKKCIILLSDGKPNDYDTYEGKYGMADVKKALIEANNTHITVHALAIEQKARHYLPQMFGHNRYDILKDPSELPAFFTKLIQTTLLI